MLHEKYGCSRSLCVSTNEGTEERSGQVRPHRVVPGPAAGSKLLLPICSC
jgi:hypothetical protein